MTLSTTVDATYGDDPANASQKLHQQHHDTIHGYVNRVGTNYVAPVPPSGVIFGDSITAQNVDPNGGAASSARGYMTWANAFLGERKLDITANAGVGGNTTAQMLARISTDVLAYTPGWVVVLGGTNDASNGVAAATTIANLKSIFQQILATGAKVVACTITPSDYINANSAYQLAAGDVNNWIRAYSQATAGMVLCDWAGYLANPADGTPLTAFFQGSVGTRVHPECDGAAVMGRVLADALRPHVPRWCGAAQGLQDTRNLAPNSTFQGSGGTITAGTGVTGTLATSWTVYSSDGGSVAPCVVSTTARTDGVQGNWQQFKLGPGSPNTREAHMSGFAGTFGTDINIGDTYFWQVEVDADNDWEGVVGIMAMTYHGGGAGGAANNEQLFRSSSWGSATNNPCYDLAGTYTGPVLLRSGSITVPTGSDRVMWQLGLQATAGTIRFGRPEVHKVVAP